MFSMCCNVCDFFFLKFILSKKSVIYAVFSQFNQEFEIPYKYIGFGNVPKFIVNSWHSIIKSDLVSVLWNRHTFIRQNSISKIHLNM